MRRRGEGRPGEWMPGWDGRILDLRFFSLVEWREGTGEIGGGKEGVWIRGVSWGG